MNSSIRNIIFDLGGVLYPVNYQLTIDAFIRLGVKDFERLYTQASQDSVFDGLEKGHLSPGEFRERLRIICGLNVSDKELDRAWNAMLLEFPARRVGWLKEVGRHYRIFLLSNTNAIHYPYFEDHMIKAHNIVSMDQIFEKVYLSHEIGMRKPDVEIFQHVIEQNGLKPEETLFIDDTRGHIQGAREAGLHSLWLDTHNQRTEDFFTEDYLLKDDLAISSSMS